MFLCSQCEERLSYTDSSKGETKEVCDLCSNLLEHIDDYFEMFRDEVKSYQFSTFLIGLRSQKDNLQRERELMERLGSTARTYKAEFQLRLGTKIETELGYRVDFERPGLTFTINQENMDFSLWVRPVYLKGRYLKRRRGIPQSPWIKPGRGKESERSISEYIGQPVCNFFEGKNYNFFASGREDVDALMLGNGRPFYVEVEFPRNRSSDFVRLSKVVSAESMEGVEILDLSIANPAEIEELKNLRSEQNPNFYSGEIPPQHRMAFHFLASGHLHPPFLKQRSCNSFLQKNCRLADLCTLKSISRIPSLFLVLSMATAEYLSFS